ncbi:hypothetical protein BpHYR1_021893, partial [Brachionus plicatilis]
MANLDDYDILMINKNEHRKGFHIPISDVDDLAFKNRHDPKFIAQITNMMQVPPTISLKNDSTQRSKHGHTFTANRHFSMEVPDKLTGRELLTECMVTDENLNVRYDSSSQDGEANEDVHNVTATPPSTPTKELNENETQLKTPQISSDFIKKIRPRRSSIEVDLHEEIRMLRDKI